MDSPMVQLDIGDGVERTLFLGVDELRQIKRACGRGYYSLYTNYAHDADPDEVYTVLRLGLIGGGMAPLEAKALCDYYTRPPRPLKDVYLMGYQVLQAAWNGVESAASPKDAATPREMDEFFANLEAELIKAGLPTDWLKGKSFAEMQEVLTAMSRGANGPEAPDDATANAIKGALRK